MDWGYTNEDITLIPLNISVQAYVTVAAILFYDTEFIWIGSGNEYFLGCPGFH